MIGISRGFLSTFVCLLLFDAFLCFPSRRVGLMDLAVYGGARREIKPPISVVPAEYTRAGHTNGFCFVGVLLSGSQNVHITQRVYSEWRSTAEILFRVGIYPFVLACGEFGLNR